MKPLLEIKHLNIDYINREKRIHANKDIHLSLHYGESLGIIGESGSGKSTLAMGILGLLPHGSTQISGEALFEGTNLLTLPEKEYKKLRWKQIAVVFQKSMNSLSPVHRILDQIVDIYQVHEPKATKQSIEERFVALLAMVNLPSTVARLYPHELSGGMLQRISISSSLLFSPKLLILDEATTALDVVTQGQILDEILLLEKDRDMARIMITHDMSVVAQTCDNVAIVYAGELMEVGKVSTVLKDPKHPYTQGLVESFPNLRGEKHALRSIPGFIPDLSKQYDSCLFAPRCPKAMPRCFEEKPSKRIVDGVSFYCHLQSGVNS